MWWWNCNEWFAVWGTEEKATPEIRKSSGCWWWCKWRCKVCCVGCNVIGLDDVSRESKREEDPEKWLLNEPEEGSGETWSRFWEMFVIGDTERFPKWKYFNCCAVDNDGCVCVCVCNRWSFLLDRGYGYLSIWFA